MATIGTTQQVQVHRRTNKKKKTPTTRLKSCSRPTETNSDISLVCFFVWLMHAACLHFSVCVCVSASRFLLVCLCVGSSREVTRCNEASKNAFSNDTRRHRNFFVPFVAVLCPFRLLSSSPPHKRPVAGGIGNHEFSFLKNGRQQAKQDQRKEPLDGWMDRWMERTRRVGPTMSMVDCWTLLLV